MEFEERIEKLTLLPSRGGVFEVGVNGELVFSKYRLGRLPEEGEVAQKVGAQLDTLGA